MTCKASYAMFKASLIMLLAAVSARAAAEWLEIGSTERTTIYVDDASEKKAGSNVTLWRLANFKAIQEVHGRRFMSSKAQSEYDCKTQRVRILSFAWYAENMGNGQMVYSDSEAGDWEPVAPDSADHLLWQTVCGTGNASQQPR